MNIGSVSGYNQSGYGQIASGKRVNTAADDAAGLTQIEKLNSQNQGMNAGAENAQSGISMTKVADGALSGISDYLQSIRESSVKAMNGLLTDSDKQSIQDEIDGYLKGISDIASGTTFNTKNILNGSEEIGIATNPDGTGPNISTADATLKALGLEGYNVTGDFDINRVDQAIDQVNDARSSMGASANALQYSYNNNMNTSENLTGATSRIEDLDIPKAISEQKKNEVLEDYKLMMQNSQINQESMVTKLLQ